MRLHPRALRAALLSVSLSSTAIGAVIACDDADGGGTATTFSVTLGVDGQGSVRSEPAAIDCVGPRDCGTTTITGRRSCSAPPPPPATAS